MPKRTKRFSLIAALGVSAVFAAYAAWLISLTREPNERLFSLHRYVVATLVATWVVADTKESRRTQPSFDYGWFLLTFFPVYVIYYLISTRRWRGFWMLVGMVLLFVLPGIAELIAWQLRR
jgi:hypothetical protein